MLISNAYAQAGEAGATSGLMGLLPLVLMFLILWFLMIRPQMKRAKEHKALIAALAKGDEVITQGGMAGKISDIDDNFVHLQVAESVNIVIQRSAISTVLPKGTL